MDFIIYNQPPLDHPIHPYSIFRHSVTKQQPLSLPKASKSNYITYQPHLHRRNKYLLAPSGNASCEFPASPWNFEWRALPCCSHPAPRCMIFIIRSLFFSDSSGRKIVWCLYVLVFGIYTNTTTSKLRSSPVKIDIENWESRYHSDPFQSEAQTNCWNFACCWG